MTAPVIEVTQEPLPGIGGVNRIVLRCGICGRGYKTLRGCVEHIGREHPGTSHLTTIEGGARGPVA